MLDTLIALFSLLYLIMYFIILLLHYTNKVDLTKKQIYILSGVFILSISFFSLYLIPGESFDLSVYYRIYDRYQTTHNLGTEFSNNVIFFKLILSFLCNLPNKEYIQYTLVFLTYTLVFCCFSILFNFSKYIKNTKLLFFSLLMQETLMSFAYIYSGGRNQISFGLSALSLIICFLFKNKKMYIFSFILSICSFLIHDSSIIIIGLFTLSYIPYFKRNPYILICWGLMIPIVIFLFKDTNMSIIQPLIYKLSLYVNNSIYSIDIRITVINTMITLLLLFILKKNPITNIQLHHFLVITLSFTLGAVIIPEVQRRMLYFVSYFSPILVESIVHIKNKKTKKCIYALCFVIFIGLGLYHFVNLKANGIMLDIK